MKAVLCVVISACLFYIACSISVPETMGFDRGAGIPTKPHAVSQLHLRGGARQLPSKKKHYVPGDGTQADWDEYYKELKAADLAVNATVEKQAAELEALAQKLGDLYGDSTSAAKEHEFSELKQSAKGSGNVAYRRQCFDGDQNLILELAHGIFGFAKGVGAFFFISGVAAVVYSLKAGPKRTSPPPVRTTTGLPYQPGDAPTGK